LEAGVGGAGFFAFFFLGHYTDGIEGGAEGLGKWKERYWSMLVYKAQYTRVGKCTESGLIVLRAYRRLDGLRVRIIVHLTCSGIEVVSNRISRISSKGTSNEIANVCRFGGNLMHDPEYWLRSRSLCLR